jgi:peptidoglycan DL-endopeptidase CwlO
VFFASDPHHVGMYAGGGQMIDAPFTGTVVRYDSIFWGDLLGGGRPG